MINFKSPNGGDGKKKPKGVGKKEKEAVTLNIMKELPKPTLQVISSKQFHEQIVTLGALMGGESVPIYCTGHTSELEKCIAVLEIKKLICSHPDIGVRVVFTAPPPNAFRPIIACLKNGGNIVPMTFAP